MRKNIQWITILAIGLLGQTPGVFGWTLQQAALMTRWADQVDPNDTWPEYPRPQMVRDDWMNLNGVWQFQSGSEDDAVPTGQALSGDILVPFPVESALSGVMEVHDRLWYRRFFEVPSEWDGQRVLLHFGAVDWESQVYVNGTSVGTHQGGYDPFTYDITDYLNESGSQELIVRVYDPTDNGGYPRGKQTLSTGGIMYTSTTGIWQTVWLEPVPQVSIEDIKLVPDIDQNLLSVTGSVSGSASNLTIQATAYDNGTVVGMVSGAAQEALNLIIRDPKLWSPDVPFLYDLTVVLKQGETVIDQVDSYFGMRKISLGTDDGIVKMLLNNEFVFQMGPLDQGFWPDGLYTPPSDEAMRWDLEMTKEFGFNMTRKHIKVEPARWYYWCDKLGLMVWQDMPSVNSYTSNAQTIDTTQFKTELANMVQTHWNHPSIVMWVVFNEFQGIHNAESLCDLVAELDPSRLVNPNSGESSSDHDDSFADVFDIHSYPPPGYPVSDVQARACGEYGGIGMQVEDHMWDPDSWGYTMVYSSSALEDLYDTYTALLSTYQTDYGLSAAVYTQITDVEIEINGLITYDRDVVKADPNQIYASNKLYTRSYEDVVPTSEETAQTWRYTTDSPDDAWYETDFDDSGWDEGSGGFGGNDPPGAVIRTDWDTSDIWIRRTFTLGTLSQADLEKLVWQIHHDEDVEVYLNGELAFSETGYTTAYVTAEMSDTAKALLIQNGTNTIAVHCTQTSGGQYIDVGMVLETINTTSDDCGQWGYPQADLDKDCQVDIDDLLLFSASWLNCSLPDQSDCVNYVDP